MNAPKILDLTEDPAFNHVPPERLKRRKFFGLIAALALAPEIAFRVKLPVPDKLDLDQWIIAVYDIIRARDKRVVRTFKITWPHDCHPTPTDRHAPGQ